jgi:ATP-dependent helicase/DNAse subunit B
MNTLIKRIKNTKQSLVIAPSSYHVPIMLAVNKEKGLYDVKYITRENFVSYNSFRLTDEALPTLGMELGLPPTILSELVEYLPYVNTQTETELNQFVTVQKVIDEKNLVEKDIPFEQLYHNRIIYIYGYPALDNLFLEYLHKCNTYFTYEIIEFQEQLQSIPFSMFHSEYDEIEYLCNRISEEISNGFDVSHIKVHITNPSYNPIVSTLFDRYNLAPYFSQSSNLGSLNITKRIMNMIRLSDNSIEETLLDIYPVLERTLAYASQESNDIFVQYIGVLNKYILLDGLLKDYITFIQYDLSKSAIKNTRTISSVFIGDLTSECIEEDDVVFIIGFNEGDIPRVTKNNKILDDSVLSHIGAETSIESTELSKKEYISLIQCKNVEYISYSTHSLTSEKIISTLSVEMIENKIIVETEPKSFGAHFSITHDLITLGKMISETKEYGIVTENLAQYVNSVLSQISYPPHFTQKTGDLDSKLVEEILKDVPCLSYSSINEYFKCNFKFLLKKIIKVPETYGERLPAIIGTLFHKTLQRIDEVPSDLNKKEEFFTSVLETLIEDNEYDLSNKELFYLHNSFTQLSTVVDWIKDIHMKTKFSPLYHEKEYVIPLKGEFITEFKGVIDLIMSLNNDFFIVDYKTGSTSINISNLEFGLESQLVFYLYLVAQGEKDLTSPTGFFYSPVFSKMMNAVDGKTYNELLRDSWKLSGYVSEEKLGVIDPDFEEGSFIKGIQTKKNSTVLKKGAKTMSTKKQIELTEHLENLLDQAVIDMESGKFDVNPKGSLLESQSCSFCEFKDICFKAEANFIETKTKEKNSLQFLKGGE